MKMKIKMAVSDVATLMQQVNNILTFLLDIDKLLYDCNKSLYGGRRWGSKAIDQNC